MRITAVKPRRKGLSGLYLDEEFVMNLDTKTLLENRFDVGREIDDEELKDVIEQSNARRAKEKALWLLTYRAHSKKELEDKLRRTCDADAAETAVTRSTLIWGVIVAGFIAFLIFVPWSSSEDSKVYHPDEGAFTDFDNLNDPQVEGF